MQANTMPKKHVRDFLYLVKEKPFITKHYDRQKPHCTIKQAI